MKTDEEIKQWIDEREVLTKIELSKFIYGVNGRNYVTKNKTNRWWNYALKTKQWDKLREHRDYKMNNPRTDLRYKQVHDLMQKDIRFKDVGKRRAQSLIKSIYKLDIPLATVGRYLRKIRETTNVID